MSEKTLEEKVSNYIIKNQLFGKSDKLLLGLSGGADSVCLLHILLVLGYDVTAVHCNFHLRGDESNRDEHFCRDLCQRVGVEIDVVHFDTNSYSDENGISIEMAARELRYDYFSKKIREEGFDQVCIAHHNDDQIETFFINLMRGSGIKGLCGIPAKNGNVVRPLLCCNRKEILDYLSNCGEQYVTDSSNLTPDYLRNKIRLDVIPLLEDIKPSAKSDILTSMENLSEACKIYRWSVSRMEEEISFVKDGMLYISKEGLLRSPSPLSLLHETLCDCNFHRGQLIQIIENLDKVGSLFYSNQFVLTIDREYLVVSGIDEYLEKPLEMEFKDAFGRIRLPNGDAIDYRILDKSELKINKDPLFAYFDLEKLGTSIIIRKVKSGDWFIPFGMKGKKLVNDLLGDKKFNRIEKGRQLILESNGKIAWVIGVRSSELFKVSRNTVQVIEFRCVAPQ